MDRAECDICEAHVFHMIFLIFRTYIYCIKKKRFCDREKTEESKINSASIFPDKKICPQDSNEQLKKYKKKKQKMAG